MQTKMKILLPTQKVFEFCFHLEINVPCTIIQTSEVPNANLFHVKDFGPLVYSSLNIYDFQKFPIWQHCIKHFHTKRGSTEKCVA